MTDRMDTEALRALRRFKKIMSAETGYRDQMLARHDGEWVRHDEAQSEIARLTAEVERAEARGFNAARDLAAKIADDEAARILSKQDGREPGVDQNLRFMALMLPEVATAIRALKREASNG